MYHFLLGFKLVRNSCVQGSNFQPLTVWDFQSPFSDIKEKDINFKAHSHIYLVINDTLAHRCFFQYCKVRWCGLYNLLVGICDNGYPLAHIPTNYQVPIDDKWAHHRTFQQYFKVRWCKLYNLLVGICENGYPLAHTY